MVMVGMDLGTTNSLVAYWDGDAPKLVRNSLGDYLTPSVVSVDDEGKILVGKAARDRLQTHPKATLASFKRSMGTRKKFKLGSGMSAKSYRPEELSAMILRSLKEDAEHELGETVDEAVITVPAYFNDMQRNATRAAGELAGIKVRRLINEPTAAAIAYGVHERPDFKTCLVLDLGGGTFDVSVLEMFEGVMQVHSSAGDNHLGGEDFARALATESLRSWGLDGQRLSLNDRSDLYAAAERTLRALSTQHEVVLTTSIGDAPYEDAWNRDRFVDVCKPLIDRLSRPIALAMRDAELATVDVDTVVLVGGASRMPVMRSLSAKMLGQLPLANVNPDEVVALGAAVQAGLMQGEGALEELVLTDVAPYSLGVGVLNRHAESEDDQFFDPIIERNTPVPVSRVETYVTVRDNQQHLKLEIYQGESLKVRDNVLLGALDLVVPPGPAGAQRVDVRFTYDIDGLLEVDTTVKETGKTKALVIERSDGGMSQDEIAKRLKALEHLKMHPRDDAANIAVTARAERLYQESRGEVRDHIRDMIEQFSAVLASQDLRKIDSAREQFMAALDSIESYREF